MMDFRAWLVIAAAVGLAACAPSREEQAAAARGTIDKFCLDCHNDAEQTANLSLEGLDFGNPHGDRDVWERVLRKVGVHMMPPPDGGERPSDETYAALIGWIEGQLGRGYDPVYPAPGAHRLNRVEYANAIRDLLGIEVDATQFLPSDDSSRGFDNQAGSLSFSPALLEAYLSAAGKISRLAFGVVDAPTQAVYRVAEDATQMYHVEGLPFGTRGGRLIEHYFPAAGEYNIKIFAVTLGNMGNFRPFGEVRGEQLAVFLDGERVGLFDWDEEFNMNRGFGGGNGGLETIDLKIPIEAGPHRVGVAFLATNFAPQLDLNDAFERTTIETGGLPGFTFYPHIGSVRIDGPFEPAGAEDTPARERIFVCTPASEAEEPACAREILTSLARRAYRGLHTEQDVDKLMEFYERERAGGDFAAGIAMALQRLLVDTKFIYRFEREPEALADGADYEIGDLELAARLSFFLWSSIPDEELLALAERGELADPEVLEAQVQRMIEDPKSSAFTENFAGQWLALRNLDAHSPVTAEFPDFDDNLRQAFRTEAELFFDSIVREDRSTLDLLTADYTFVNDRLAKHYGIPGVQGSHFRRVTLGDDHDLRRGLLGKGAILTTSSQPGRTAPVIRGNWIMANLLGVPAPRPPPDVPPLETNEGDAAGNARQPTLREQYEAHQQNPACRNCHILMDPFGFALEPFDAIGRLRSTDAGNPIDSQVVMYDSTPVEGPQDLREFVLKYSDRFVLTVAEKLMTYALGRGMDYADMPLVRAVVAEAAEDDYRLRSMIAAVVQSPVFRMNTKGAVAAPGADSAEHEQVAALAPGGGAVEGAMH